MRRFKLRKSGSEFVVPVRFPPEVVAVAMIDWVGFCVEAIRLIKMPDGSYSLAYKEQQAVSVYGVPQVQQTVLAALDLAEAVEKGADDIEERAAQVKRLASPL